MRRIKNEKKNYNNKKILSHKRVEKLQQWELQNWEEKLKE